ncbi:MAG: DUF2878 domain-containing protein [Pseudomonadales bacterium]|nr:DUF2878 domain-containing protein [Pseudomonadales bacterium]
MKASNIVNLVLFNLTWFACVLGGSLIGLVGVAALLCFSITQGTWRADGALAVFLIVVGWSLDSVWVAFGVLDFDSRFAPLWIGLLWVAVGFSINHSLAFFRDQPVLGALITGLCAPLSYLGGEKLGAVVVPEVAALGVISISWVVLFYGVYTYAGTYARDPARITD